jgi:hypothetical protein
MPRQIAPALDLPGLLLGRQPDGLFFMPAIFNQNKVLIGG